MSELVIVAHLTIKDGKSELFIETVQEIIKATLKEKGCIKYDLHQDKNDQNNFMFYEIWESYDLWQDHMATPHIKAFGEITKGSVIDSKILEMSAINQA